MGDGSLRLSPWQSLMLTNISAAGLEQARTELSALGLLCQVDEPLVRVVACTGSSGCAKALAETKADAVELAAMLGSGAPGSVHLSGCPVPAPWPMLPRLRCWPVHRAAMTCICVTRTCRAWVPCAPPTLP